MSIIYDEQGFPHRPEVSDYDNEGFLQPSIDIEKEQYSESAIIILQGLFPEGVVSNNIEENRTVSQEWNDFTESPDEIYIMIGNGFDLECGLPTSYINFLNFLNAIIKLDRDCTDDLTGLSLNHYVKSKLVNDFKKGLEKKSNWQDVINNFWLGHFLDAQIKLGWVDFENEIAKVVKTLENSMELVRYHRGTMEDYISSYESSELYLYFGELLEHKRTVTVQNPLR